MKLWKKAAGTLAGVLLLCGAFLLGRFTAGMPAKQAQPGFTFHGEILSRDGPRFHVNGLDCNGVNGRGEFTFSVEEDTPLVWRGTALALEDLQAGDRVAVTYTGDVLETYPVQLTQVARIDLLEDEK